MSFVLREIYLKDYVLKLYPDFKLDCTEFVLCVVYKILEVLGIAMATDRSCYYYHTLEKTYKIMLLVPVWFTVNNNSNVIYK